MTLLVMAAGIGSRFGKGIKQLQAIGPNGEIIIDYSVHDALEVGFDKFIFVIRKDIEADFEAVVGKRIRKMCEQHGAEVIYVYQSLYEIPEGYVVPEERKKPWGTGQAVLAAKKVIHEPLVVINADDYYGKEGLKKMYDFLNEYSPENPNRLCMAGFLLRNTLSEYGGVTRGICELDEQMNLRRLKETAGIQYRNGKIMTDDNKVIEDDKYVSMNMWGLTPEFVTWLGVEFEHFFQKTSPSDLEKKEFLLPVVIDQMLQAQQVTVRVLETNDQWIGVTYQHDISNAIQKMAQLHLNI